MKSFFRFRVLQRDSVDHQIVIVVDGATDRTEQVAHEVADVVVVHPQNCGYGRSLKSGILAAKFDRIVITDADGTYPIEMIPRLLSYADRFDMVVGARSGSSTGRSSEACRSSRLSMVG